MSFDDAKYENVEEGVKFLDKLLGFCSLPSFIAGAIVEFDQRESEVFRSKRSYRHCCGLLAKWHAAGHIYGHPPEGVYIPGQRPLAETSAGCLHIDHHWKLQANRSMPWLFTAAQQHWLVKHR